MIQKLQKLRHKKGFTLVELIIVIAITAVLMACVAAFAWPINKMAQATSVDSDALNINKIIGDYIEGRLAYANYIDVRFCTEAISGSMVSAAISSGVNTVKSKVALGGSGAKGGVLIFHYNSAGSNSSYELYDVPITSTGAGSAADAKVFTDDFYGKSQRIIYTDHDYPKESAAHGSTSLYGGAPTSTMRDKKYISFEIMSYKSDDQEYSGIFIKPDTLRNIYNEAAAGSTATLDELSAIKRGGSETVTFKLENMSGANSEYYINSALGTGPNDTDIAIFYYIPKF